MISWSTREATNQSIVIYESLGNNGSHHGRAIGQEQRFQDGGSLKRVQYIHRVILRDLQPGQRYEYICGCDLSWSKRFHFKTVAPEQKSEEEEETTTRFQPHLAIFGDMGLENAQALSGLQKDTEQGMYDAILHVGDFAYDLDTNNSQVGDAFMQQLESVAAYVPYMVAPGNHEEK